MASPQDHPLSNRARERWTRDEQSKSFSQFPAAKFSTWTLEGALGSGRTRRAVGRLCATRGVYARRLGFAWTRNPVCGCSPRRLPARDRLPRRGRPRAHRSHTGIGTAHRQRPCFICQGVWLNSLHAHRFICGTNAGLELPHAQCFRSISRWFRTSQACDSGCTSCDSGCTSCDSCR